MSQKFLDLAGLTAYDKKIKQWFKAGVVDITDDAIRALFVTVAEGPADNEIWYTSTDGTIISPSGGFGASIVSNEYKDGKGIIKFDNSVMSIGDYAFSGCRSLTSITIPNSVTSIGFDAFYGCSGLTKTNYTGDIAGWCNINFIDTSSNPITYSNNFYINDQEIKDLVIPNSVTSIGNYAFRACSSLTSVTIPNSVTSIGDKTFISCSGLTSITFPNSVTSIGEQAFSHCSGLTSISYDGTQEQWNAVTKGTRWNYKVPATYVQCTDGQVTL